ncbi:sce7725 family protein [Flavobacterium branchiarum]|uniref:Sce7725 family protein n=1 Tax=Flavobacterium branchiarum TaxID=1114870 RepID=A0ABV5FK22_9FLAO|nr:sce7725 family protein [Flavobacterium branchiarum]MDN3672435.1 sce7725 family protein [Flavobacterium branchiarum]
MYYPYLRARQFELISLRELIIENIIQNYVTPILEPVKDTFNNLNLAHKLFKENNFSAFLIVNPLVGELNGDVNTVLDYLDTIDDCCFLPAFHYTQNSDYISRSITDYNLSDCMLICYDNFTDDDDFRELCRQDFITHITLYEPHKYRNLDRFLKGLGKNYIRLDNVFERQLKNADFLDIQAHKFSEEHLFYQNENFDGFSDFTVLPSEFIDGGSTPRAVVIHLTYLNIEEENQIWIRHFTSNTNDSIANVQGKFAEAALKATNFCEVNGLENSAIAELRNYYLNGRYPGLGTVKKISIKNHLNVVRNYLESRNNE